MRVLYVEDSGSDAELARIELRRHDPAALLEVAPSLAEARRLLASGRAFDLALLDLRLPDGNGLELLREIRERRQPLAVVVLTGAGDEETAIAALKTGADDYLAKHEGYVQRLGQVFESALERFRAESARRERPLRVLYAEHHTADAELTRRHLEAHAPYIRLEVVASGEQLLRRLPRHRSEPSDCDVVMLDYRLPGESALDLLKVIRQERGLALPVLIVTGQGSEETAVQALRLGADDYLVKSPGYLHALPAALANAHHRVLLAHERAALRDSEERFRQITERIGEVFWMTDLAKGKVLYVSPAYESIWGRSCASLYENPGAWLDAVHPDDRERIREATLRRPAGGHGEEYRIVRPDGSVRFIRDRAFAVPDAAGNAYRVVGVAEDVTERHQAEEERRALEAQLRQSQKLEAVARLAGGVAHDFNNVLGVILGHAELALRQLPADHPLAGRLGAIHDAAARSAALTRQLLGFSRRQAIAPRVLDLNAQLEGMQRLLQRMIGEDVELRFVLAPDLWPVVLDPSQVDQVVANLAVNARDAMPEGGRLTVETANVLLDEADCRIHEGARPGEYVMLAVSDSGTGMDSDTRERAFEPFFTTKPEGKGTGLGLATVYGIARQNDGFVGLDSELGRGTAVRVYLPRSRQAPQPRVAAMDAASSLRGQETVLVVEDEAPLREVAASVLEELGYRVLRAPGAAEAIALSASHAGEIDVLLTDVVMPGMSGRRLADELRSSRPGIRVIFTSGYAADMISHRGVLEAGTHFLEKPFTRESLGRKLREVLASPGAIT